MTWFGWLLVGWIIVTSIGSILLVGETTVHTPLRAAVAVSINALIVVGLVLVGV